MNTLNMGPLDELWVLIAGCMVFLMQAGFLCLEAGFSRSKNSINVAFKNFADYVVASICFLIIGYGLMFGRTWHGIVGVSDFFLLGLTSAEGQTGRLSFFFFHLVFCGTATSIVSGAVAERMKLKAYLVYSFFISIFFYPLFGHWVWGGVFYTDQQGWLAKLGYLDFAGASVVHQMGGWVALAGIVVLGPRLGKFDASGCPKKMLGHNIPLSLLGVFILWFGWFGFNGGVMFKMSHLVGLVIVNTNTAAAAGAVSALLLGTYLRKHANIFDIANGALGGLVAITASAAYVSTGASLLIGVVAGLVVVLSNEWLEKGLKLDDVVGAVPVHGFCGLWGIMATAIFARPDYLLHADNRLYHLGIQLFGSGMCFVLAFGGGWVFFKVLHSLIGIRVSPEAERVGLNVSEHQAVSSIHQIIDLVQNISGRKDWSSRVEVDSQSEAGELSAYFNDLLRTVENTVGELEKKRRELTENDNRLSALNRALEQSRSSVEARVRARTEELTEAKSTLEKDIQNRTQELTLANEELQKKMTQLETLNQVMMGREKNILILKKEVDGLLDLLGREKRYEK